MDTIHLPFITTTARRIVCAGMIACAVIRFSEPAGAQAPAPVAPPEGQARGLTPEIETILRNLVAAYRNLESYQDEGRLSIRQVSGRISQVTKMPSKVLFRRPNLLQVTGGMQTISCDGKELQIVLDNIRQYQQQPAPAKLTMEHVRFGAPGAGLDNGYPEILAFLLGENVYAEWISQIRNIELGKSDQPKEIDGHPTHVVFYESIYKALVTMWIDQESFLLLRFDIDNTPAQLATGAPAPRPGETLPTMDVALQLHPVVVNGPAGEVIPNPFALRHLTGMKKVDEFEPGAEESGPPAEPEHPLVGHPLPAILGSDLAGRNVDSSTLLAGKPAVVFFWSPAGDPGSLAALQMMQRVADRFPDLGVVSIIAPGQEPALIKDLLEAKKTRYPALIDQDGRFMRSYSVAVMPAFFLIGPDGTVRAAFEGAPHEAETGLLASLEGLLAKKAAAAPSTK